MPILLPRPGLAVLAALSLAACASPVGADERAEGQPQSLPTERLVVHTARGPHAFTVQVADSEEEREVGLMFVKRMPADRGMVFEFAQPSEQAFWMRNTFIPLDIVYIGPNGRIVSIARDAKPLDESPLPSNGAAVRVLEINGGLSSRLGIEPGDHVDDPAPLPAR